MAAGTYTVAGQRVRTSSTRRYVAWVVERGTNEIRGIAKRSDSLATISEEARKRNAYIVGWAYVVVIDTATGEEVRV